MLFMSASATAQMQSGVRVAILRAEDSRRYDESLVKLLRDQHEDVRIRAALAAGRIGDERAVEVLAAMLNGDASPRARAMAAFALGEIESIKAADVILTSLREAETRPAGSVSGGTDAIVTARLVEAAGKIAAANAKDEKAKELGRAILATLERELAIDRTQHRETVLLALTAALRARPEGADAVVAKFLLNADARVRADAANTLSRLRAKNANERLRAMLGLDVDPIVRANAARALGAAEDKESYEQLLAAAIKDADSRVRVSAVRSLGSIRDSRAVNALIDRGRELFAKYKLSRFRQPNEKSELLEIVAVLGRLLAGSADERAVKLVRDLRTADAMRSPESEIAFARISPGDYVNAFDGRGGWQALSAQYQGLAEVARFESPAAAEAKLKARLILVQEIAARFSSAGSNDATAGSRPDLVRAFAAFKSDNTSNILRPLLENERDVFTRAAIADALAEQPSTRENVEALQTAFTKSLTTDKIYNDAQLSILDALFKLDRNSALMAIGEALERPDQILRLKALDLLATADGWNDVSPDSLAAARKRAAEGRRNVWPYDPKSGTKLGQVLNTDADYRRALSRKNGTVRAVVTTEKGAFTIELLPEDAPLTVDNFIKLARSNYFNGLEVHRVVPNFVMQDGDPRGDGNGGPGWSIRCEINLIPYGRGAVGMALSGKDTGGSQWFVTHSPQPHLDGGYTVFGRVNESGMKVVDNIVRGDRVISIRIVESRQPPRSQRTQRHGK